MWRAAEQEFLNILLNVPGLFTGPVIPKFSCAYHYNYAKVWLIYSKEEKKKVD